MEPLAFDPFNDRGSRDIRNTLSKAFLRALTAGDASLFQRCGSAYMQKNLHQVYKRYVSDRLSRYGEAYAIIKKKKRLEVLPQAVVLWDLGLFFEMHELLETEWKEATGERRRALQGLIRAAGMKIHAASNREKAAAGMGVKARADLLKYGRLLKGFNLAPVLAEIEQTLASTGKEENRLTPEKGQPRS